MILFWAGVSPEHDDGDTASQTVNTVYRHRAINTMYLQCVFLISEIAHKAWQRHKHATIGEISSAKKPSQRNKIRTSMLIWPGFDSPPDLYDLSHLNARVIVVTREASGTYPARSLRIFVSYSNHCFTNHFADDGKDDKSIYPHAGDGRYFCEDRYQGSLVLPELIPELIEKNVLLGRAVKERRETFFYLEEHRMGRDFRIYMKIEKSNHPDSDIRLIVTSCHPEETWAAPVGVQGRFTIWRVMDAKVSGEELAVGAQQRRRRR